MHFASSSPWEMGSATGAAYSEANAARTKPIIFWGVWLFFGPTAVGSIWSVITYVYLLVSDNGVSLAEDSELIGGVVLSLLGSVVFGFLSVWALWCVSKGFFRGR